MEVLGAAWLVGGGCVREFIRFYEFYCVNLLEYQEVLCYDISLFLDKKLLAP